MSLDNDNLAPRALVIPSANGATTAPSGSIFISGGKLIFATDSDTFETVTSG